MTATVWLKKDREKSLLRHHPWVFSGAIARLEGKAAPGEPVELRSSRGDFLGRGAYSPSSQITVRVWTFDEDEEVGPELFRRRLENALALRQGLEKDASALRLVNAESDGLPGVVIDRYGSIAVCQFTSAGAEWARAAIVEQLGALLPLETIYERSDPDVRTREGLAARCGLLYGAPLPDLVEIVEEGRKYLVDIASGHKTGFYLDQRENRTQVGALACDAEVLNCFCYTGGFTVAALKGGARHVTSIDASAPALELVERNLALNGLDTGANMNLHGDVFLWLRKFRDQGRRFDLIVLDPPRFADSHARMTSACRGYKDINLLAFKLLNPGGILATFSCSGLVTPELFQKIVADAALDAHREALIVRHLTRGPDHPVALSFPEGTYLKGLICRAL